MIAFQLEIITSAFRKRILYKQAALLTPQLAIANHSIHETDRYFFNCSASSTVVLSQASSRRSFINTERIVGRSTAELALGGTAGD